MNIVFFAFNFGVSSRITNGPGMSLLSLVKCIKFYNESCKITIFTQIPSNTVIPGVKKYLISDSERLNSEVESADFIHHWSGSTSPFKPALRLASRMNKKIIIGPNVIDCVNLGKEKRLIKGINPDIFLSVNDRLKFKIAVKHNIMPKMVKTLIIGPDLDLWTPPKSRGEYILWKGNSNHKVKDIEFGLNVANKLSKYEFRFIGHPKSYNYFSHIDEASSAKLYYCTSISETKGMALAEQWAAGVPSVTHPGIYLHGINYETGIITNRDVDSYCEAIEEIMENDDLYNHLSNGAYRYVNREFGREKTARYYMEILSDVS